MLGSMRKEYGVKFKSGKPSNKWWYRMLNMYKIGLVLDYKPMKVLARFGTKSLHSRSSGNKELITVIEAVNADGEDTTTYDTQGEDHSGSK